MGSVSRPVAALEPQYPIFIGFVEGVTNVGLVATATLELLNQLVGAKGLGSAPSDASAVRRSYSREVLVVRTGNPDGHQWMLPRVPPLLVSHSAASRRLQAALTGGCWSRL